jgi:uncharacterized protein YciI
MHYLLFYDIVPDYVERRAALREEHLGLASAAHARGELILGGALADPTDGAVLLFRGDSPAIAEAFAAADPYVRQGLVTRWRVRAWATVVGEGAGTVNQPAGNATSSWTVHRLDDNGNRFVMREGLGRAEAMKLVAEFEFRGHKQTYWAEPAPA